MIAEKLRPLAVLAAAKAQDVLALTAPAAALRGTIAGIAPAAAPDTTCTTEPAADTTLHDPADGSVSDTGDSDFCAHAEEARRLHDEATAALLATDVALDELRLALEGLARTPDSAAA
jgi:hypothetical protein